MKTNASSLDVGARTSREGARTVAHLWGEHDVATADQLAGFLGDVVERGDDLVVDLSEIRFMDATTIGAIVRARSRNAGCGGALTVRSPSTVITRALEACGLAWLIEPAGGAGETPDRGPSALESWIAVPPRRSTAPAAVPSVARERQECRE